jgi:transmembrane sensor
VAPLAAFTLGRVYLDHLGQPHRAAESFGLARRLAPAGSLAQDALAREVESLSKGGDEREANVKAKEYLRDYPRGRRLRAVQLYGGIE